MCTHEGQRHTNSNHAESGITVAMACVVIAAAIVMPGCCEIFNTCPDTTTSKERAARMAMEFLAEPGRSPNPAEQPMVARIHRLRAGDRVSHLGSDDIRLIEEDEWFVWVDDMPFTMLGHPTRFLFISDESGNIDVEERDNAPVVNDEVLWDDFEIPESVVLDNRAKYTVAEKEVPGLTGGESKLAAQQMSHALKVIDVDDPCCEGKFKHKIALLLRGHDSGHLRGDIEDNLKNVATALRDHEFEVPQFPAGKRNKLVDGVSVWTRRGLENLRKFVEEHSGPEHCCDQILVYYTGHGGERNSKNEDHRFFLPLSFGYNGEDGSRPIRRKRLYPSDLADLLRPLGSCHINVVIDACHGGAFKPALESLPGVESIVYSADAGEFARGGQFDADHGAPDPTSGSEFTSGFVVGLASTKPTELTAQQIVNEAFVESGKYDGAEAAGLTTPSGCNREAECHCCLGACCIEEPPSPDLTCVDALTPEECKDQNGHYLGHGSTCMPDVCDNVCTGDGECDEDCAFDPDCDTQGCFEDSGCADGQICLDGACYGDFGAGIGCRYNSPKIEYEIQGGDPNTTIKVTGLATGAVEFTSNPSDLKTDGAGNAEGDCTIDCKRAGKGTVKLRFDGFTDPCEICFECDSPGAPPKECDDTTSCTTDSDCHDDDACTIDSCFLGACLSTVDPACGCDITPACDPNCPHLDPDCSNAQICTLTSYCCEGDGYCDECPQEDPDCIIELCPEDGFCDPNCPEDADCQENGRICESTGYCCDFDGFCDECPELDTDCLDSTCAEDGLCDPECVEIDPDCQTNEYICRFTAYCCEDDGFCDQCPEMDTDCVDEPCMADGVCAPQCLEQDPDCDNSAICSETGYCCIHDGYCDECPEPDSDCSTACVADADCDDGSACTEDWCESGVCAYGAPDCGHLDDECSIGVCSEETSTCERVPVNDGGLCSVGVCNNGSCTVSTGACCTDSCEETTQSECNQLSGAFSGTGTTCADSACEIGACYLEDGTCLITVSPLCAEQSGEFGGTGTFCE